MRSHPVTGFHVASVHSIADRSPTPFPPVQAVGDDCGIRSARKDPDRPTRALCCRAVGERGRPALISFPADFSTSARITSNNYRVWVRRRTPPTGRSGGATAAPIMLDYVNQGVMGCAAVP